MQEASPRFRLAVRVAAVAFFIGCGFTHIHIFVHATGLGVYQAPEAHEIVFHLFQAVGAWLFIVGAMLKFQLHVVSAKSASEALDEERRRADEAVDLASRDPLTGLRNRRRFDEELALQVAHTARYDSGGALLMIDLDGFKGVNDAFGHAVGDQVLRGVAQGMNELLRITDVLARIGGDEFAVIARQVDREQAGAIAEKLVKRLRGLPGAPHGASVSIGAAAIDGEAPPEHTYERADDALYRAKHSGGDRHVMAPAPLGPGTPESRAHGVRRRG